MKDGSIGFKKSAVAVLAVFAMALAALAYADRSLRTMAVQHLKVRAMVGATPQWYDTISVSSGERVELVAFAAEIFDSAMTPTLNIDFLSLNNKTRYYRIVDSYTTRQNKVSSMTGGPFAFPKDTTVLVYYNVVSTAPGTLDTLNSFATYRLERP